MPQESAKRRSCLDLIGLVVAVTASLLLLARALLHFDDSWDGTSYHLVFAAFRAHLLTPEDFQPISLVVTMYQAYPQLFDFVRGFALRMSGSILALQIFNLIAIGALVLFWKWRYRLAIRWALIAILTVPLIQIGAPTLYVDVFANCFFAVAVSAMVAGFLERRPLGPVEVIASLCGLVIAANVKPQFVTLGIIALAVLSSYQLLAFRRVKARRRDLLIFFGGAAVAWLLVPLVAFHNVLVFGNPVYPLSISMFGHQLPGLFPPSAAWRVPDYLAHVPQPIRWLASILEYRAFEGREVPYNIDQYGVIPVGIMPSLDLPRLPSYRMGGFFVPLVLGLLVSLAHFTRSNPLRERWRWVAPVLMASAIAFLPGSNELRYYTFWMFNLIFLCMLASRETQEGKGLFQLFLLVAFAAVGFVTGFQSFDPTPYGVQDHIRKYHMDRVVTGRDLCFENRNRDTVLFTWIFHEKGRYRVVDLDLGQRCPSG